MLSAEELKEKVFRNSSSNDNDEKKGFGKPRTGNLAIKEEDEYDDEEDGDES